MGQAARRQTVRESARESVRAQHTIERASSSSVALSFLLLLPLLCLVLYMCAVRVCVFECALSAKLIFLFIKKKSKYICIFVCCAAFFFSSPSSCFLPPPHTEYYFCCCCQKHNLCFIYDFLWFSSFSHWHFLFAWNLFDLYAAPLGHTLLSDLKETRTRTQTRTWTQTHTGGPLYIASLLDFISDSESGSDLASHLRHNLALACCIYRLLILFWCFIYTRDSDKD